MNEAKQSGLMIDLDSLFDTRLGTLILNYDDVAEKIFLEDKYHNRLDDSFNGSIDRPQFTEFYDKRDATTIANSTLTIINDVIYDFIRRTHAADPSSPYVFFPVIYLNVYPYKLTDAEKEIIKAGVVAYFNNQAPVEVVDMDYKQLTVGFVKEYLTVLILYEYNKWLDEQTLLGNFNKGGCPGTTLFAPRIFFKEIPKTEAEVDKIFLMLENISKPFINLELLPSIFFSTYLKATKVDMPKETTGT
jgi:hypothetical protein